ncbi:sensor histidine kinase [Marinobacter sp. JSM 1782161]|uniref:sensor histidine kinase n=1 Tax=Marinobacter sp. JSM 1782161 TaxID=2685906 RepID=UPI001402CABE|nr:HAMP domain-containing sensor histidine kinase [Marinobacter sp. JSM 1782161]
MIRQIRLKWQLAAIFLGLGALLVGGYSLLAAHYFMLGMDSTMVGALERAVERYEDQRAGGTVQPDVGPFTVTSSWQEQPEAVRRALPQPPHGPATLAKQHTEGQDGHRGRLYFAMRFQSDGGDLFISHAISRKQVSDLVEDTIHNNLNALLIISIGSALALAAVIWLVMRRVAKPVARLGEWAHGLETGNLRDPLPDFRYPELNELAGLVRSSLSSLENSLEREHRFLRHTSHELRTPISVIRNNVELIRSLPPEQAAAADSILASIIDRVDRASLTMKHLTETLLWLSREEPDNLPTRSVALDHLIQELVSEHRYLLRDKDVTLDVQTDPATVALPDVAARVVIGNLIRNAFQHTWAGEVSIRQHGHTVHIDNHQASDEEANDDLGFGLGLQLTAQLTERLGWTYRNDPAPGGHRVILEVTDAGSARA